MLLGIDATERDGAVLKPERCAAASSLEVVFLERRPGTLDSDAARKAWRADFARLRSLAEPS